MDNKSTAIVLEKVVLNVPFPVLNLIAEFAEVTDIELLVRGKLDIVHLDSTTCSAKTINPDTDIDCKKDWFCAYSFTDGEYIDVTYEGILYFQFYPSNRWSQLYMLRCELKDVEGVKCFRLFTFSGDYMILKLK